MVFIHYLANRFHSQCAETLQVINNTNDDYHMITMTYDSGSSSLLTICVQTNMHFIIQSHDTKIVSKHIYTSMISSKKYKDHDITAAAGVTIHIKISSIIYNFKFV